MFLDHLQWLDASSDSAVLTSCNLQHYANAAIAHMRVHVHLLPLTTAARACSRPHTSAVHSTSRLQRMDSKYGCLHSADHD
jgi:hypothetical protein